MTIGNHVFKNWSKTPLGDINCVRALAMSNNPFMYQMGLKLGAEALMDTARAFGLGERTGLPIPDDPGLVPTSDYMIRNYKRDFMSGDAANLSIGQGTLLVTPLQVAHMMSGVANGYLPQTPAHQANSGRQRQCRLRAQAPGSSAPAACL